MIFLSYSRLNAEARRIEAELRRAHLPFWRDATLVEGDPFWRKTIRQALEDSSVLAVIWSKEADGSPYIHQEIRAFLKDIVFIALDATTIPVARAKVISSEQAVEFFSKLGLQNKPEGHDPEEDNKINEERQKRIQEQKERAEIFISRSSRAAKLTQGDGAVLNAYDGTPLIKLPQFHMSVDPVANSQYKSFIQEVGLPEPPTWQRIEFTLPNQPVTGVTAFEAEMYAAWVGGRLPTEAEWEYAALGGRQILYATQTGEIHPSLAFFGCELDREAPCQVDAYPPNAYGLRGMCGNSWDWTASKWGENCVIKGGGFMDDKNFCRIPARYRNSPIDRDCCVGFRVLLPTG